MQSTEARRAALAKRRANNMGFNVAVIEGTVQSSLQARKLATMRSSFSRSMSRPQKSPTLIPPSLEAFQRQWTPTNKPDEKASATTPLAPLRSKTFEPSTKEITPPISVEKIPPPLVAEIPPAAAPPPPEGNIEREKIEGEKIEGEKIEGEKIEEEKVEEEKLEEKKEEPILKTDSEAKPLTKKKSYRVQIEEGKTALEALEDVWNLSDVRDSTHLQMLLPDGLLGVPADPRLHLRVTKKTKFEPRRYTTIDHNAAVVLQSWWRGWLVRSRVCVCAVAARLLCHSPIENTRPCPHRSPGIKALDPWPRHQVRLLRDFLMCLENGTDKLKPRARPSDTIAAIYNERPVMDVPFTFSVERRAMRQLEESRQYREQLERERRRRETMNVA